MAPHTAFPSQLLGALLQELFLFEYAGLHFVEELLEGYCGTRQAAVEVVWAK